MNMLYASPTLEKYIENVCQNRYDVKNDTNNNEQNNV